MPEAVESNSQITQIFCEEFQADRAATLKACCPTLDSLKRHTLFDLCPLPYTSEPGHIQYGLTDAWWQDSPFSMAVLCDSQTELYNQAKQALMRLFRTSGRDGCSLLHVVVVDDVDRLSHARWPWLVYSMHHRQRLMTPIEFSSNVVRIPYCPFPAILSAMINFI